MNREEMKYNVRKRWVFFGLPFTFTVYHIGEDLLTIDTGFFKLEQNDCYMYKVSDVKLTASLLERICGLGTVICYTGDITTPELRLTHVKRSKEIKAYLLKQSETARLRRRTLNTVDIGAHNDDLDHNGIPDSIE